MLQGTENDHRINTSNWFLTKCRHKIQPSFKRTIEGGFWNISLLFNKLTLVCYKATSMGNTVRIELTDKSFLIYLSVCLSVYSSVLISIWTFRMSQTILVDFIFESFSYELRKRQTIYLSICSSVWHKGCIVEHLVRIEFTRNSLLALIANHCFMMGGVPKCECVRGCEFLNGQYLAQIKKLRHNFEWRHSFIHSFIQ